MSTKGVFNIRVYGLIFDNKGEHILLSDEWIKDTLYTKFPGGGLEFGEGIADCLKRELFEELQIQTSQNTHFYTTDFFQPSYFHTPPSQIISVYYLVHNAVFLSPVDYPISTHKTPLNQRPQNDNAWRWCHLDTLTPNMLDLPIDQHVVQLLITQHHKPH